ncbi:hypothetical protein O181_021114, partial [Austropuccinia psidii MF-1]|nr:hypothetical protein [Austropuccinia psidii MF-1]
MTWLVSQRYGSSGRSKGHRVASTPNSKAIAMSIWACPILNSLNVISFRSTFVHRGIMSAISCWGRALMLNRLLSAPYPRFGWASGSAHPRLVFIRDYLPTAFNLVLAGRRSHPFVKINPDGWEDASIKCTPWFCLTWSSSSLCPTTQLIHIINSPLTPFAPSFSSQSSTFSRWPVGNLIKLHLSGLSLSPISEQPFSCLMTFPSQLASRWPVISQGGFITNNSAEALIQLTPSIQPAAKNLQHDFILEIFTSDRSQLFLCEFESVEIVIHPVDLSKRLTIKPKLTHRPRNVVKFSTKQFLRDQQKTFRLSAKLTLTSKNVAVKWRLKG